MFNLDLGGLMTSSIQASQQLGLMKEQVGLYRQIQGPIADVNAETARLGNVAKTDEILEARESSIERSMDKLSAAVVKDPWLEKLVAIKQDRYEATSKTNV